MNKQIFCEEWQNGLEELNNTKKTDFVFAIQTDTHFCGGNAEPGNNLKRLAKEYGLDFYANLGDMIRGYSDPVLDDPANMRECMDEMVNRYTKDAPCPVGLTVGNHDTNAMWYDEFGDEKGFITEIEHFERIMKPLKKHNGDVMFIEGKNTYYYIDFEKQNIRIIMVNTINQDFSNGNYKGGFKVSKEQIKWIKEKALQTDKKVIIMSHTPLTKGFPKNNFSENSEKICEAVEEFIADGGDFLCYFCGHVHEQLCQTDENGRVHISFRMAGSRAEVIFMDLQNRKIDTVGLGNVVSRKGIKY